MCVLRVSGENFSPDDFLKDSSLEVLKVYYRGQPRNSRPSSKMHEDSGFNIDVSDGDWGSLAPQVEDALAFLTNYRIELERLRNFPGVEGMSLDFPLELRIGEEYWTQSDRFPAGLAKLAGELGMDLEFSIYPCSADDEN